MASIRRAVIFSMGQRYLAFVLQLGTSIILARLLTPEETGIFSMAAAAVAIGHTLRELGTGEYIISQRDLTVEKMRAAYAVTVVSALVMAAVLALLAQPLAAAYNEPGIRSVLYLLSLNFMLLPLGSVGFAVLARELAFDKIFVVQSVTVVVSSIVTVAAALQKMSYLSPAVGSLAGVVVSIVMLTFHSKGHVFMRPSLTGWRHVLRFGGPLTIGRVIEQVAFRSAEFIVSGLLGFHATGLMSKANTMLAGFHEFFNSALTRVATPALAQAAASPELMRKAYSDATVMLSMVQGLFFSLLAIFGSELILVLFGAAWLDALSFVQIGAIGSLLYAPFMLHSSVLTAAGAVKWQLRIQLLSAPVYVLCICLGAMDSLAAVAALSVTASVFRLMLVNRALKSTCGISVIDTLRALRPTMFICTLAAAAAWLSRMVMLNFDVPPILRLAVGFSVALMCAFALSTTLAHPIALEVRRLGLKMRSVLG